MAGYAARRPQDSAAQGGGARRDGEVPVVLAVHGEEVVGA